MLSLEDFHGVKLCLVLAQLFLMRRDRENYIKSYFLPLSFQWMLVVPVSVLHKARDYTLLYTDGFLDLKTHLQKEAMLGEGG